MDVTKYSRVPGDSSSNIPEFAGFLGGMGSLFLLPTLVGALTTGTLILPAGVLAVLAITGMTMLSFLGIDALRSSDKIRANSASNWILFPGYIAGVSLMIASHNNITGILAGFGLMAALAFTSLFSGAFWDRIKGAFGHAEPHKKPTSGAAINVSPRAGFMAGLVAGGVLALALGLAWPHLVVAGILPLLGGLLGWYMTQRPAHQTPGRGAQRPTTK
jgi:hypothetical protein